MKNQRYRIKPDPDNIYINGCLFKYGFEVRNDRRAEQRLAKQLGFESDDEDLGDFETSENATELIDWEI